MPVWYDSVNDETIEEFESTGEVEILVAQGSMITANKTVLKVRYREGKVVDVGLKLFLDRSQLYRATKKTSFFGVQAAELLNFDPNIPIQCELTGGEALIKTVEAGLEAGREVEDVVTQVGKNGFPMFFDLDNYILRELYQVKE
jgi:hypothetical protein